MKWIKGGLIFRPEGQSDQFHSHASIPIADRIEGDLYRIYFAARDKSNRSHTTYVDVNTSNPKEILSISKEPVLWPGKLGTFDDSGAMPSWIVNNEGKKYLYYTGWNLGITVPFYFFIGLAIGDGSGRRFEKVSEAPILGRNRYDPYLTASPCVIIENEIWRMWYVSGAGWKLENGEPKHYYNIKYAESKNGIDWQTGKEVCIDFKSEEEYAIARPCVVRDSRGYKMWYSHRAGNNTYRIGYAESPDGILWKRKDHCVGIDVSNSGWDSQMIEYPFVFENRDKWYMLYNGDDYGRTGFGYATLSENAQTTTPEPRHGDQE